MERWNITWLAMPNTTAVEAQKSQEIVNSHKKLITIEEIFLNISNVATLTLGPRQSVKCEGP
jgi:hypothetical protein